MADAASQANFDKILTNLTILQGNQAILIEKQSASIELLGKSIREFTMGLQPLDVEVEQYSQRNPNSSADIHPSFPLNPNFSQQWIHNWTEQTPCLKSMRFDVPRFFGENSSAWISRIQRYFNYYATPDPQRLKIASFYLDGNALDWYEWMRNNQLISCWKEFLEALDTRFGPGSSFRVENLDKGNDFVTEKPTDFWLGGVDEKRSLEIENVNATNSKTDNSVFTGAQWVSNYNKYQLIFGEDTRGLMGEPAMVKFPVVEMFLGSIDDLMCTSPNLDYEISRKTEYLGLKIDENTQEFVKEEDNFDEEPIESTAIDLCYEEKFPESLFVEEEGPRFIWVKWINKDVSYMKQGWYLVGLLLRYSGRKAVFGNPPPSLPAYITGSSVMEATVHWLYDRDRVFNFLNHNRLKAQLHVHSQADIHRRGEQFKEGQWYYIRVQPLRQSTVAILVFEGINSSGWEYGVEPLLETITDSPILHKCMKASKIIWVGGIQKKFSYIHGERLLNGWIERCSGSQAAIPYELLNCVRLQPKMVGLDVEAFGFVILEMRYLTSSAYMGYVGDRHKNKMGRRNRVPGPITLMMAMSLSVIFEERVTGEGFCLQIQGTKVHDFGILFLTDASENEDEVVGRHCKYFTTKKLRVKRTKESWFEAQISSFPP